MNRAVMSVAFALIMLGGASAQKKKTDDCYSRAKTQAQMNQCAGNEDAAADRELNKTYQEIVKKYSDRPEFIKRLREAQRIWLQLRDAQLRMRYPLDRDEYGSV